jgi:hypothetical protein
MKKKKMHLIIVKFKNERNNNKYFSLLILINISYILKKKRSLRATKLFIIIIENI